MPKPKNMSQRERTTRHKEKHSESEARRKESQRERENLLRFHIYRRRVSKIPIPDSIDSSTPEFKKAEAAFELELAEETITKVLNVQ